MRIGDFPHERPAAPSWVVLVPLAVAAFAWWVNMTKKKQPSVPPPRSSAPREVISPLPKGPTRRWVTPRKGALYEPLFLAASAKYRLPAGLLSRQAYRESHYNPQARSSAGALGIMQIIPRWHPSLDPGDAAADARAALDPKRAIPYAAKLLRSHFDRFGSWTLALAAYNAGPTAVAKYRGVPPYTETRNYIAAILPPVGITEPGVRYA